MRQLAAVRSLGVLKPSEACGRSFTFLTSTANTYPLSFKARSKYIKVKALNTRFNNLALIAWDLLCIGAVVCTITKFQATPVTVSKTR